MISLRLSDRGRPSRYIATSIIAGTVLAIPLGCGSSDPVAPDDGGGTPTYQARDYESLSEVERASVDQQLEERATFFNVTDPPDVEIVRLVRPEELEALIGPCLDEQGFGNADTEGIPSDQAAAFDTASYVCTARYPIDPALTGAWGDEQIRRQYAWTVDTVIPCLEDAGYDVAAPPSEEVFVANWVSDPYFPFAELPLDDLSQDELDALAESCPQQAPSEVLWG